MAKTKTRTSGRVGNRFWKLLGASTDKDQARSMSQVRDSAEFDEKAADLGDEQLRKAAQLLNLDDLADSADITCSHADTEGKTGGILASSNRTLRVMSVPPGLASNV